MKLFVKIIAVVFLVAGWSVSFGQTVVGSFTPETSITGSFQEKEVRIKGIVTAPKDELLPGAVVHLKGTKVFVVSNATGEFELMVPSSATSVEVTCSYMGLEEVITKLPVRAAPHTIHFKKFTSVPVDRSAEAGWW